MADKTGRTYVSRCGLFFPACLVVMVLLVYGCSRQVVVPRHKAAASKGAYRQFGKWYKPLESSAGFTQEGMASWYGDPFHGRKTASGEVYNMYDMTAAHKTLPLGTMVRVTNRQNGKSVDVRINDRGPFVRGRIIDLSYAAARKLGILGPGTAPVRIVALGRTPGDRSSGIEEGVLTVQVGAFASRQNADNLRAGLSKKFADVHVSTFFDGRQTLYRVRVGRYHSRDDAQDAARILADEGFKQTFIVAE